MDFYKTTSVWAISSFYCMVAGILFLLIAYVFTIFPFVPMGMIALAIAIAFGLSFILAIVSIIHLIIWHNNVEGWLLTLLSLFVSAPVIGFISCIAIHSRTRAAQLKEVSGEYNLRILGSTLLSYAKEKGSFPDPSNWCDTLMAYNPKLTRHNFQHPKGKEWWGLKECHFCYNRLLGGKPLDQISPNTILLFESNGDWNLNGTGEMMIPRSREDMYIAVIMVDKRVRNYWFDQRAIRDYSGGFMIYESPRWAP